MNVLVLFICCNVDGFYFFPITFWCVVRLVFGVDVCIGDVCACLVVVGFCVFCMVVHVSVRMRLLIEPIFKTPTKREPYAQYTTLLINNTLTHTHSTRHRPHRVLTMGDGVTRATHAQKKGSAAEA